MLAAAKVHSRRPQPACAVSSRSSTPASRRSGLCRSGSSSLHCVGTRVISPQSLGANGARVSLPPLQDIQLKRPPSAPGPNAQQALTKSKTSRTETPTRFALFVSSLAGTAVTVEASCKDMCSQVQEKIACELDVPPQRATISTKGGVVLSGAKTLEEFGILEDVELFVVIGEPDMPREAFIELVVARNPATQEHLLRSLRSQPANLDEMKFRAQYIPRLEAKEKEEERELLRKNHRDHVQESVASEMNMQAELGMVGAADRIRARIECIQTSVDGNAALAQAVKIDAQADLDEALPALDLAFRALDTLTKAAISEVKALKKPPAAVALVGEAVCILFGEKPTWEISKVLFNDCQLLHKMKCYDKDAICPKIIMKLNAYIQNPDFVPVMIRRSSSAAQGMCSWLHSMHVYDRIAKRVEPKRQKLMECEGILQDGMWELQIWQEQLATVLDQGSIARRASNAEM